MGVIGNTKSIDGATSIEDESGLKLKIATRKELYNAEAQNILKSYLKYLSGTPLKSEAPFSYEWLLELHKEMFSDVWEWAGKLRTKELSIGVKAYLVSTEIKKLYDDIVAWEEFKTFDIVEIATRIHHRAVYIHPFQNGNGRWSRLLTNIYLKQNGKMPISWNENSLSSESIIRDKYISALKEADNGNYKKLIDLHRNSR